MEAIREADHAILPGRYYGRAGNFVSHLARDYGEGHLVEFARRTRWKDSFSSFQQAFLEIFDASLEDVIQAYEADYPECGRARFRSNEGVCSSQPPAACADGSDDIRMVIRLSCADPATIGPRDGEIVTHVVFDIPAVVAIWSVDGPVGGHAFLRKCEGGCGFSKEFTIPDDGIEWWIEGGRYVLRLSVPEDMEGEFQVVVREACLEPNE